jgi:GT2 family glycosyltransferase
MSGSLRLSVVTPTHRRAENLKLMFQSLKDQTLSPDRFEVIVIDDASGDETGDVLRDGARMLGNLRYEQFEQNGGPARARNRGIELAEGDVLVFLDDDVAAAPDLLEEHLRFHEAHPDGSRALLGRVDWHPSLRVTPFMRWLDSTGLQFAFDTWLTEGEVADPCLAFYMANISISRAKVQAVGGFDERFPNPAFEDYELGWRLTNLGLKLFYRPQARAFHTRAIDLKTFRRRTSMVAESFVFLKSIHPDFPLEESGLTKSRLTPGRRLKLFAYAPVARLIGDNVRLGRVYRELLAQSYVEGKRRGIERLA